MIILVVSMVVLCRVSTDNGKKLNQTMLSLVISPPLRATGVKPLMMMVRLRMLLVLSLK